MGGMMLLNEVRTAGLIVSAAGDRLKVRGPRRAEALARELLDRKGEILALLRPDVPEAPEPSDEPSDFIRWSEADERGCRPCKACHGPIIWAEVVSDTAPKAQRRRWMKLDPDLMPHGCGTPYSGRVVRRAPPITTTRLNGGLAK